VGQRVGPAQGACQRRQTPDPALVVFAAHAVTPLVLLTPPRGRLWTNRPPGVAIRRTFHLDARS
jgi:hypothetical protein